MAQNRAHLHRGHRHRMFQRFMEGGFDGYCPHEILEQLLFEVLPRRNTNELAHELTDRFGSLRGVLLAGRDELLTVRGVGERTADFLVSVLPTVGRAICGSLRGTVPERGSLLVTADFFLTFCAFPAGVVLLDGEGVFLDFLPYREDAAQSGADFPDGCRSAVLIVREGCADTVRGVRQRLASREIRLSGTYVMTSDHRLNLSERRPT